MNSNKKVNPRNLIVHNDYDGLLCAILILKITNINPDNIIIAEPKEIRENKIPMDKNTIICDLPLPVTKVHLAIDHHSSCGIEPIRNETTIFDPNAKSCARVIFEEFKDKYPQLNDYKKAVDYADKLDSGNLTKEEYKNHNEYSIISMSLKSRDREFDKYFIKYLIKKIMGSSFKHVSMMEPVQLRYNFRTESIKRWKEAIKPYVEYTDGVIMVDMRKIPEFLPKGASWELYMDYPDSIASVSIFDLNGTNRSIINMGENIFNRKNQVHLGQLAKKLGNEGGGHKGVGQMEIMTCDGDGILKEVVNILRKQEV